MNTYRIAFIGHRKIDGRFRFQPRLDAIIKEMITRKVRLEFYVGCEGAFDTSCNISFVFPHPIIQTLT